MANKKYIFELSEEQNKALESCAKAIHKSKSDLIRMFCNSLIDKNPYKVFVVVHDDKKITMNFLTDKAIETAGSSDENIEKISIKIENEKTDKEQPKIRIEYKITKKNTIIDGEEF